MSATVNNDQGIVARFRRHRLAAFSLWLLGALGVVGLGAEFFAPHHPDWNNTAYLHAPPQPLRYSWEHGIYVHALEPKMDAITRRWHYEPLAGRIVRVSFFVPGKPYRLMGLIPMERRLFGVRMGASPDETIFLLGADGMGRDVLSRLVFGTRISLGLGLAAVLLIMLIGTVVGSLSGYVGGWFDGLVQRAMEIINAFPHLPLFLGLSAALPRDWSILKTYFSIIVILTLLGWTGIARVVRGKVLSLREEEYVVAARLLGAGSARILGRHILPGFFGHLAVSATLSVPTIILGETALSFLGLGLRDPVASWGVMIQDCVSFEAMENYPWLFAPVVAVVFVVTICNLVGEGLREAIDPYSTP